MSLGTEIPTTDEPKWDYDIKDELNAFIERVEPTFLELYLIRQGFKYNEEESDLDYSYIEDKAAYLKVYDKPIKIIKNKSSNTFSTTENYLECNLRVTIQMYEDHEGTPTTTSIDIYLQHSDVNSIIINFQTPKKIKYNNREIYLFKKLKYILDTLK